MKLNRTITLAMLGAVWTASFPSIAAEILYAPETAEKSNLPYSAGTTENQTLANPKFVDDADLNFDEIMLEDLTDEPETDSAAAVVPAAPPEKPDNLPLVQKKTETSENPENTGGETLPAAPLNAEAVSVGNGKSLTETISEKKNETEPAPSSEKENQPDGGDETWINKLKMPLNALNAVSEEKSGFNALLNGSPQNSRRSNASVFNISGVMLRMSGKQVDDAMQKNGFRKIQQKYDIPNFIRWRNEEACRNNGVVGYERLESCVVDMARKNKHQYVSLTKYSKFSTKEEISVSYTSNFTGNKVYRIAYKSMAAGITGNSQKAIYLRNVKIYDFWRRINQKYGAPDNREQVVWGLGGNKPYMRAATGFLLLEDPMLRELDYTRMSREDQRYMNTDIYSF